MRQLSRLAGSALLSITLFSHSFLSADDTTRDVKTLVVVDRHAITSADLDLKCLVRGIAKEHRDSIRQQLLERLVDERLISDFLRSRRVQASPVAIDAQIELLNSLIRRRGDDPTELLSQLGFTEDQLRQVLSLSIAWNAYVVQVVTDKQLRDKFEAHRREWDGTQVRARHIVLKVPADATDEAWSEVEGTLTQLRQQITSGSVTFTEAAQKTSESPSASAGGDVGFFPYRGTMSSAFADAAFALQQGEISEPVRTSVGVHLIEVTDEQPGQLSLEDVRTTVLDRISQEMWDKQVAQLRADASIQWSE